MTLHKIEWQKLETRKYCNASRHRRKRRIAKWYNGEVYYCKHCAQQLWRALNTKPSKRLRGGKGYRRNEKSCTERTRKLRQNATWAEKIFRQKLRKATKLKFKFQRAFIKGGYYAIVDFYIPSRKLCIEIDGEYHNKPSQKSKDDYRDNWLRNVRGQTVVRFTNEQAKNMTIAKIKVILSV